MTTLQKQYFTKFECKMLFGTFILIHTKSPDFIALECHAIKKQPESIVTKTSKYDNDSLKLRKCNLITVYNIFKGDC